MVFNLLICSHGSESKLELRLYFRSFSFRKSDHVLYEVKLFFHFSTACWCWHQLTSTSGECVGCLPGWGSEIGRSAGIQPRRWRGQNAGTSNNVCAKIHGRQLACLIGYFCRFVSPQLGADIVYQNEFGVDMRRNLLPVFTNPWDNVETLDTSLMISKLWNRICQF